MLKADKNSGKIFALIFSILVIFFFFEVLFLNKVFCFRDIYTIDGDRPRLKRWVDMTRSLMGA